MYILSNSKHKKRLSYNSVSYVDKIQYKTVYNIPNFLPFLILKINRQVT